MPDSRTRGSARPWLIAIIVIVLVVLGLGSSFTGRYNNMVRMREAIKQNWSEVDVNIQRRADLIPNLVATVQGFAKQEQKVIGEVTSARAALGGARTPQQTMSANNQLDGALSRLLVIVENYPQLKSNQNFLALQDELTGTENRIAVSRRQYNLAIQNYDAYIGTFPNNVVAHFGGMPYNDQYFQTSETNRQAPPKVSFPQ
ncbi:MAG TPA: LemA family protein [Terriglobales bacterium]|nr:LemA family protein [Terriglobales bacterium]